MPTDIKTTNDQAPLLTSLVAVMTIACFTHAAYATYEHQAKSAAAPSNVPLAHASDRGCAADHTGRMEMTRKIGCEFARLQNPVLEF